MKKIIALLIILPIFMLAACAPSATPPSEETAAQYHEEMTYHSMDEFYSEVNKAKENKEKKGEKTYHKIEEIEYYYDFKNPVKDVVLDLVNVTYAYVTLYYRDKDAKESDLLKLVYIRTSDFDLNDPANEEEYLDNIRKAWGDTIDIMINGHNAVKHEEEVEVYDDNKTTTKHIEYYYYWVEDGTAMFLSIPAWLLERYPEETFFDIEKEEIKKPDAIK